MRLIVSGGGTAGHVSPVLATIDALRRLDPDLEVLYVGRGRSMEERLARAAGLDFAAITSGKFRRSHGHGLFRQLTNLSTLLPNLVDLFKVGWGVIQSLGVIRRFRPDVVFAKSGFVGLPVGLACRVLGVPYVIHESDLEPGLANKVMGRWASAVAVGFPPEHYKSWPTKGQKIFSGNPVRAELLKYHRLEGVKHFGFDEKLPVVLITGGSQGAVALNRAVLQCLPELLKITQVIHLTGEYDIDHVRFELRSSGALDNPRYVVRPFLSGDMGLALAAADIVVSRAGANTIAELAALAKPTILVPNQGMAGHQLANARLLSRADAVRVIYDDKLTGRLLLSELTRLVDSPDEAERLGQHIRQFAVADSSRKLAELIMAQVPKTEADK